MNLAKQTLIALTAGSLSLGACSKKEDQKHSTKRSGESAVQPTPKPAPDAPESFATALMNSYEQCRAALAGDSTEPVPACAKGIVDASKDALARAPEAAKAHISSLVASAEALGSGAMTDIEAVRARFGEVSKSVVDMLTSSPDVAKNYHLFECPMATGYQKWAQPHGELENPYMGAKMLACGSELQFPAPAAEDPADADASP